MMFSPLALGIGGIGAALGPAFDRAQLQNAQNLQNDLNSQLGNQLGFVPYQMGVPTAVVRCAYCGKRPKAESDDRCDGCGAPR